MRVISLNLNGIRSAATKGFYPWLAKQQADFVCLQELKAHQTDLSEEMAAPPGYQGVFHCAEKKGYSGVGLYLRTKPKKIISGVGIESRADRPLSTLSVVRQPQVGYVTCILQFNDSGSLHC